MTSPIKRIKVAILVCPGYFPLDVLGAHAVFGLTPNSDLHLVWKNMNPFSGFPVLPGRATTTLDDCPEDLDVLIVGAVPPEVAEDEKVLCFFQKHAARGCNIIGICAGVLILGAAGLLQGRKATSNFQLADRLAQFGARPINCGRVVVDGNLYTAGPATGGIEAALIALARISCEEEAQYMELLLEYSPHPPFGTGNPELADPGLVSLAKRQLRVLREARLSSALKSFKKNQSSGNIDSYGYED